MNIRYIRGMAITTAAYRCDWTQDTSASEMREDFDRICEQAREHCLRAGIDTEITHSDVLQALWGLEEAAP